MEASNRVEKNRIIHMHMDCISLLDLTRTVLLLGQNQLAPRPLPRRIAEQRDVDRYRAMERINERQEALRAAKLRLVQEVTNNLHYRADGLRSSLVGLAQIALLNYTPARRAHFLRSYTSAGEEMLIIVEFFIQYRHCLIEAGLEINHNLHGRLRNLRERLTSHVI